MEISDYVMENQAVINKNLTVSTPLFFDNLFLIKDIISTQVHLLAFRRDVTSQGQNKNIEHGVGTFEPRCCVCYLNRKGGGDNA